MAHHTHLCKGGCAATNVAPGGGYTLSVVVAAACGSWRRIAYSTLPSLPTPSSEIALCRAPAGAQCSAVCAAVSAALGDECWGGGGERASRPLILPSDYCRSLGSSAPTCPPSHVHGHVPMKSIANRNRVGSPAKAAVLYGGCICVVLLYLISLYIVYVRTSTHVSCAPAPPHPGAPGATGVRHEWRAGGAAAGPSRTSRSR